MSGKLLIEGTLVLHSQDALGEGDGGRAAHKMGSVTAAEGLVVVIFTSEQTSGPARIAQTDTEKKRNSKPHGMTKGGGQCCCQALTPCWHHQELRRGGNCSWGSC